jgi:formate/nitrite transporter FocA (FNT family)
MYLAVSIYKEKGSYISVLFCVPAFILAGFEHSIADMFYFAASGIVSLRATGFIWIVILGNALGGMLLPMLSRIGKSEEKK